MVISRLSDSILTISLLSEVASLKSQLDYRVLLESTGHARDELTSDHKPYKTYINL